MHLRTRGKRARGAVPEDAGPGMLPPVSTSTLLLGVMIYAVVPGTHTSCINMWNPLLSGPCYVVPAEGYESWRQTLMTAPRGRVYPVETRTSSCEVSDSSLEMRGSSNRVTGVSLSLSLSPSRWWWPVSLFYFPMERAEKALGRPHLDTGRSFFERVILGAVTLGEVNVRGE